MFTKFISGSSNYNSIDKYVNAPLFRKKFKSQVKGARLEICVVGLYRLFINGKEITRGILSPYFSNPTQIVFYDEYQIDDLNIGENEISILLGNGFNNSIDFNIWKFSSAKYRSAPKLALNFYQNDQLKFIADEDFEVYDSPIFFDDYRAGERYDARLECKFLNAPKKPIIVEKPEGKIVKSDFPPIKIQDRVKAIKIVESVDGGFIYDFGDAFSGVCELNVTAKEGQVIDIFFGEIMKDGKLFVKNTGFGDRSNYDYVQHDQYICKEGKQAYIPSFTYHGFRFACVKGVTKEQATKELLTAILFYSDIQSKSEFSCDNEIINELQKITLRSDATNFVHFPTDCPHREKNGWTGDIAISSEQYMYNFETKKLFKAWLRCVALSQKENGAIPCIVPTDTWGYEWGAGMGWDTVVTDLAIELYRFYGDIEVLIEASNILVKYIPYLLTKFNKDGLIEFGLGEWCDVGSKDPFVSDTPIEVSCSLLCIDFFEKASKIFSILGKKELAQECAERKLELIKAFRNKYVEKDLFVSCRTQTAQSWALVFGVFKDEELAQASKNLVSLIYDRDDKITVGALGAKALFKALSNNGYNGLAFKLITSTQTPNYGSMVKLGLKALPERIIDIKDYPYNASRRDGYDFESLNHHFWGSISAWFYRYLGGINVLSAKEIEIAPSFDCELNKVHARLCVEDRSIEVNWARKNGKIKVEIINDGYNATFAGSKEKIACFGTTIINI